MEKSIKLSCSILYTEIVLEGTFHYNENFDSYLKKIKNDSSLPDWQQSNLALLKIYKDGFKGIYKEIYKSDNVRIEIPFIIVNDNFYAHGVEKIYYEGLDDMSQRQVYVINEENNFVNGSKSGIQKQYFTNGQLMYETLLEEPGKPNHQKYYKKYHLNGSLKEEVYPNWGKKYYESGELLASWNSYNYVIIGEYIQKFRNGAISMRVNYLDDDRDGLTHKFFESGKLKELWGYEKGKRKFVKKYFDNGNIKTEWLYDRDGNEISKTYYDIKGNLISK